MAAHADDDKLLLVTLQDGVDTPEFNGSTHSDQNNGNKNMTDISVPREDYNKLVLAQGKADDLNAQLTAATTAKTDAETVKKIISVNIRYILFIILNPEVLHP